MKFKSDIEVQAGLKDSSGSVGASGQILSSTSGNVSWVTPTVNTVARDVQNTVKAGVAITKGQAVYVTGADGTNIIVGLASNTSEATSSKTLGLLNATVAVNGFADVVQIGRLSGLNTAAAVIGDPVWLGTNGNLIYGLTNKPYAPAHLVFIGVVTRVNANNGEIFITVQNGFELKEIHDVDIITNVPINGDVLGYDGTLWVNKTIAEWLGYTPANASGTTNYVSKFTGTTTLGNSQIFDNGTSVGIGTASPAYKLDIVGDIKSTTAYVNDGTTIVRTIPTSGIGYFGTQTNHPLAIQTNSDEKVRITTSGNVGIGTTAPSYKLDVTGDIRSTTNIRSNNGTVDNILSWTSEPAGVVGTLTNHPETFWTNGSEKMRITSSGNVGIGTTSPLRPLNIVSNGPQIRISDGTAPGTNFWEFYSVFSTTNQDLLIGNQNGYALNINATGNVGIGTGVTSATNKLQVVTSGTALASFTGAEYSQFNIIGGSQNFYIQNYNNVSLLGTKGDSPLLFTTYETERMRITSTGNVGIGTSSPGGKLDVVPSAQNAINVARAGGYPSLYGSNDLVFETDSVFYFGVYTPRSFQVNSSFNVTSAGNVGIGNGTPTQKLHVTGNARITGGIYDSANAIGTSGQVLSSTGTGTSWVTPTTGTITGSGTTNYVTKFTGTSSIGNSQLFDNGNVGIGTSTPDYPLTVSGPINVGASGANLGIILNNLISTAIPSSSIKAIIGTTNSGFGYSAGSLLIQPRTGVSAAIAFATEGSEKMRIDAAGNVGIGTTSPSQKLSVSGNISLDTGGYIYGDTTTPYLRLNQTNGSFLVYGSSGIGLYGSLADIYSSDRITLQTNGSERMRITSGGNVGIGNTTPTTKLEVTGVVNSYATMDNLARRFNSPEGASYITTNSSIVGAIKIKLPVAVNNSSTMMSFRVKVYQYSTGQTSEFQISGYNYSGGNWYSPSVTNLSDNNNSNFYVYFGTDATSDCIWIGETTSSWVYPQVFVTDFQAGYGGQDKAWATGWAISFVTSYDTIELSRYAAKVITSNNIGSFAISGSGSANYVPKFTGSTSLGNSLIYDNGTNVGINNTSPNYALDVIGSASISSNIYTNNVFGLSFGTVGYANSNTLINTYTGKDILFAVNSSEKMRLTAAGSLGIGTSSPSSRLHVAGGYLTISGTDTNQIFLEGIRTGISTTLRLYDNASVAYYDSYATMAFRANQNGGSGGNIVFFGGNVGVGTSSPSQRLTVGDGTGTGNQYLRVNSSASDIYIGQSGGTILGLPANSGQLILADGVSYPLGIGTIAAQPLILGTQNAERMRITSAGNVGIGTTSPTRKLTITGGTDGGVYILSNSGATTLPTDGLSLTTGYNVSYLSSRSLGVGGGIADLSYSAKDHIFDNGSTERMRINSAGNVGIGTSNPLAMLHVASGAIRNSFGSGQGGTNYFNIIDGVSNGFRTIVTTSNQISYTFHNGSNQDVLSILNSGNVGIGTTSPAEKLDVNGNITLGTAGGANYIQTNGGPNGTAHYYSSGVGNGSWDSRPNANSPYITQWHTGLTFNASSYYGGIRFYNQAYPNLYSSTLVMSIANDNVGIGTSSPNDKLSVVGVVGVYNGTSNLKFNAFANNSNKINSTNFLAIQDETTNVVGIGYNSDSNPGVVSAKLLVNGGIYNSTNLYNTGTGYFGGNVGIGTTSPGEKLQVAGNIAVDTLELNTPKKIKFNANRTTLGTYGDIEWYNYQWDGLIKASIGTETSGTLSSGTIIFKTSPGGSNAAERMRVLGNGNVGIGNSAPNMKLQISGNENGNWVTLFENTSTGGHQVYTGYNNGTTRYGLYVGGGGGDSNSYDLMVGPTSNKLVVKGDGNVGIGTSSPTQKLHVAGSARITGAVYDSSNSAGSSGQVLSSTGSGTAWVTGGGGGGGISGSGSTNFIPKFTGSTSVGNSLIYDTGTSIGINTSTPGAVLDVQGSVNVDNAYAFVEVTSNEAWIGAQAGNGGYSYAGGEAGIGGSGDSMATLTSRNTSSGVDARFGLQGVNSTTGDENFFTAKKVITGSGPSDPYTPKKWMKIWSEDNNQFYWINLYE